MIPKLPSTIDDAEMGELMALYEQLPDLRRIPFDRVLATNYLITPLRRTNQAQKRAAANFALTPPPAPAVTGSAPISSSSHAPRAAVPSHR